MTIKQTFSKQMANYPYELEKGPRKFTCPQCGGKKKFRRVIRNATGAYLPDNVGVCDRVNSCGYEYTWKQYLQDNPDARSDQFTTCRERRIKKSGFDSKTGLRHDSQAGRSQGKPEYLEITHLLETLTDYDQNAFVQFLLQLFPFDSEAVCDAVVKYGLGTKNGYCVFPTIAKTGRLCKAKLIKFDAKTGRRIKADEDQYSTSSLQYYLKREGRIRVSFETNKDVFFGEHLLSKYPELPIAIVESEKSAVIGSICKGVFPDMVWLACGSGMWLKTDRLRRLGPERTILLFPDADPEGYWFSKWQSIAADARRRGSSVNVSNLIELNATDTEKVRGYDLADYLIQLQLQRNAASRDLIEERLAIMTNDGGLSVDDAEAAITASRADHEAIRVGHDISRKQL